MIGPRRASISLTARTAEAARAAAMERALRLFGSDRLPPCLHGPEESPDAAHAHAFWLPEDRDGDGWLDHLTVFAAFGFDATADATLDGMTALRLGSVGAFDLCPALLNAAAFGPARVWRSATPYMGPLHSWRGAPHRLKAGRSAADQLARDLVRLRDMRDGQLPGFSIGTSTDARASAIHFRLTQRLIEKGPSHPVRGWFEIAFDAPVLGPINLGFGAHFGLGQFRATLVT